MRTIKRISRTLNTRKLAEVQELVDQFSVEKDKWMKYLQCRSNICYTKQFFTVRNALVAEKYTPVLPNGYWKCALDSACKQMDMYWQALFVETRKYIFKNPNLTEDQKKWCYAVLRASKSTGTDYNRFGNVRCFIYESYAGLKDKALIKQAGHYLNRTIDKQIKRFPRVKLRRSMDVSALQYTVYTRDAKQFLALTSFTKGKRILIPLKGFTLPPKKNKIGFGSVSIVLKGDYVEMHYTADTQKGNRVGPVCALDFGYTEVATDDQGNQYGKQLGEFLTKRSNSLCEKNRNRNKLRAVRNKAAEKGLMHKVRRIDKFNLGTKKRDAIALRNKETIARIINEGLNKFMRNRRPSLVIVENLTHAFKFKGSRSMNRKLSGWVKGSLKERLEFKASAGRSSCKQVNAAYTSQTCPECGYVDRRNRTGDTFKCLNCGHEGHSDSIAAVNILSRNADHEITSYMSARSVQDVLFKRFRRRRESGMLTQPPGTVIA